MPGLAGVRRRMSVLFDDSLPPGPATRVLNAALAILIVVNVACVVLESVPSVHGRFEAEFWCLEQTATVCFAVEYLLRVWTAVDLRGALDRHPLWGRLRYMRGFFALTDLVAIMPAILGMLGAADLRTLRLLRLLRMIKLTRHATIFNLLWAVFREEAQSIGAVLFILFLILMISASLMYMIEGDAQPDGFSSIPAAMWWAIETLTTVGYGDLVPTTVFGKVMGGLVSIVGIVALALFTSLITVSFIDQIRVRREALRQVIAKRVATDAPSEGEIERFEQVGDRLGLTELEIAETIGQGTTQLPTLPVCPHCGHSMAIAPTTAPRLG
jgi:voltage-gated potassium channel